MIIKILIVCLFVFIGIMLSLGKWSFLIAGYNTMSKEEKEGYDTIALCKFMGKLMFIIAFCIVLFILSDVLMMKILFDIGNIAFRIFTFSTSAGIINLNIIDINKQ